MGTCGLVGQIGVYTGWADAVAAGTKTAITGWDWAGLVLICFVLPALLTLALCPAPAPLGLDPGGRPETELIRAIENPRPQLGLPMLRAGDFYSCFFAGRVIRGGRTR